MALTNENNPMLAKAWCKFNGTGTAAIVESFNVSSLTDNGTGNYTTNLSITMSSTTFPVLGATKSSATPATVNLDDQSAVAESTTSIRIYTGYNGSAADHEAIEIFAFGDVV